MRRFPSGLLLALACAAASAGSRSEAAFPFLEDFTTGTANWKNNSGGDVTAVPSGGPSGDPYISQSHKLPAYTAPTPPNFIPVAPVVIRAEATAFNSSNSAFAGNWLTAGIREVTAFVRHNAPVPLEFNMRFASPTNNPGASYGAPAIAPNVWTKVTIDVTPTSPQLISYGSAGSQPNPHATVFANIGRLQLSAVVPVGFTGNEDPVTFDLDRVTISVPEPATLGLACGCLGMLTMAARRRQTFRRFQF